MAAPWLTRSPVVTRSSDRPAHGVAAVAGYPSVTVPMRHIAGLPYGILFFGPAWSESVLLAAAAEFEGETNARRAPEFRATAAR